MPFYVKAKVIIQPPHNFFWKVTKDFEKGTPVAFPTEEAAQAYIERLANPDKSNFKIVTSISKEQDFLEGLAFVHDRMVGLTKETEIFLYKDRNNEFAKKSHRALRHSMALIRELLDTVPKDFVKVDIT